MDFCILLLISLCSTFVAYLQINFGVILIYILKKIYTVVNYFLTENCWTFDSRVYQSSTRNPRQGIPRRWADQTRNNGERGWTTRKTKQNEENYGRKKNHQRPTTSSKKRRIFCHRWEFFKFCVWLYFASYCLS